MNLSDCQIPRKPGSRGREESADHAAPVGQPPIVEDCGVGPGIGVRIAHAAARMLHVVLVHVERAPTALHVFAVHEGAGLADIAPLKSAIAGKILLNLLQANAVAAARHQRKTQLRKIVLPAADEAHLVKTRLTLVHQVAATGTGKLRGTVHDSLATTGFPGMPSPDCRRRFGSLSARGGLGDRIGNNLQIPSPKPSL